MARFVFYFNIQDWIIGQKILKLSKTLRLKVFLGWYLIWCCPKNIGTTFPIASLGPGSVKPNDYWISFYQLHALTRTKSIWVGCGFNCVMSLVGCCKNKLFKIIHLNLI